MPTDHRARITWSAEQVRQGLPAIRETIDPAWFDDVTAKKTDGWSLICRFESPPNEQENPSTARVRCIVAEPPHERHKRADSLRLFERRGGGLALVEILE